jgi:hypothetical protein
VSQQVLITQRDPAAHPAVVVHVGNSVHKTLPSKQIPPPSATEPQMQLVLLLHATNVSQTAPAHSAFGPDTWAIAGLADASTIGTT